MAASTPEGAVMGEDPTDEQTVSRTRDVVEGRAPPGRLMAELVTLVQKHRPRIYGVCFRIVRNPERAEELAQDALLIALERLPSFSGRSSLSTWVCGIAKWHAMNAVRLKAELLTEDGVVEPTEQGASVLKELSRAERVSVVREVAAACLDAEEQEAIDLRYVESLPYEAIAGCMGLEGGAGAVRAVLTRARRHLKPAFEQRLKDLGHSRSFVMTSDRPDDR